MSINNLGDHPELSRIDSYIRSHKYTDTEIAQKFNVSRHAIGRRKRKILYHREHKSDDSKHVTWAIGILQFTQIPSMDELMERYRVMIKIFHPDLALNDDLDNNEISSNLTKARKILVSHLRQSH